MREHYRPGVVVDGRYRLTAALGAGGMGSLFIAVQTGLMREVALKVLPRKAQADVSARERFVREARGICHLKHPNLVTYHDFGTDEATGQLYLVMELLSGRSLARVLSDDTPLPASRVVHIAEQLCDALAAAHKGRVIHRDLKPANIMLVTRGGDPDFVKLIDFGIARTLERRSNRNRMPSLTQAGMIIGTTGYLAPEYIQHQIVDERTDIYALGVIIYELIAGRRPFVDPDPTQVLYMHLKAPVPPLEREDGRDWARLSALNRVVLRTLEKDPARRYRTVGQLRTDLLLACQGLLEPRLAGPTRLQHGLSLDGASVATDRSTSIDFAPSPTASPLCERPPEVTVRARAASTPRRAPKGFKTRLSRQQWWVAAGVVLAAGLIGALAAIDSSPRRAAQETSRPAEAISKVVAPVPEEAVDPRNNRLKTGDAAEGKATGVGTKVPNAPAGAGRLLTRTETTQEGVARRGNGAKEGPEEGSEQPRNPEYANAKRVSHAETRAVKAGIAGLANAVEASAPGPAAGKPQSPGYASADGGSGQNGGTRKAVGTGRAREVAGTGGALAVAAAQAKTGAGHGAPNKKRRATRRHPTPSRPTAEPTAQAETTPRAETSYGMDVLLQGGGWLTVDGRRVGNGSARSFYKVALSRGTHRFLVEFECDRARRSRQVVVPGVARTTFSRSHPCP